MNKEDLNPKSLTIYLKMQIAVWAEGIENDILSDAGLFTNGCPFCGDRDTCPVCNKCDEHHSVPIDSLDEEDLRSLSVAAFFTSLCRGDPDEMMMAMMGIAHPDEVVEQHLEACPNLSNEKADEETVALDLDVWGEFGEFF